MKKASNIIAVLLIVLSCFFTLWFIISKIYTNKYNCEFNEKEFFGSDFLSETEDINEQLEEQLYDKQLVANSNKEKFVTKFSSISDYLKLNDSSKSIEEFTDYIINNYSLEFFLDVCNNAQENISRDFYLETGKSLFVVLDEFIGNTNIIHMESKNTEFFDFMFAGDICLTEDGFVMDHYETTNVLKDWISESIIERTNNADIFMLNNEFCYSEGGTPLNGKLYTFRALPQRVDILKEMGTDIVSLANNHVYDYGNEAFEDTLKILDEAQIERVGAGINSSEAEKVIYYEINGLKIGILSASRAEKVRYTPEAKEDRAGIFLMYDVTRLLDVIKKADSQCDFLISYIHWGTEDSKYFEEYQREIAKQMIDAGTDAIIGGHPHVLQGIEYIDNIPVVYSLGDFWFNHESKYTALINLRFDMYGIKDLEVIPCLQSNFKTTLISDENTKKAYYEYLRELSSNCNIDDMGIVSVNELSTTD